MEDLTHQRNVLLSPDALREALEGLSLRSASLPPVPFKFQSKRRRKSKRPKRPNKKPREKAEKKQSAKEKLDEIFAVISPPPHIYRY